MPSPPGDDSLLDRARLRQLAGEDAFGRGERVFAAGRVRSLRAAADRASARVVGSTRLYRVKLWRSRGDLHHACTCPLGREGGFCKHAVAVGLAWLAGPGDDASQAEDDDQPASDTHPAHEHPAPGDGGGRKPGGPGGKDSPVAPAALRAFVHSLDKRRLADLVLEALDYDEILRRRLMMETTGVSAGRRLGPADLETYRRLLREAIETGEYVDYDAMPDYVQGIEEAIAPLHSLLEADQPGPVVELCELALVELDRAADLLDSSDGSLNGVYDELQRLHLEACRLARPDPVGLAGRLLHYELEGGMGVFNNAAAAYAEVLGPRGLAAYRGMLAHEWERLPPLRPGRRPPVAAPTREANPDDGDPLPLDYRRFQLAALMERLAASAGADPDTLAAIKARDLSSPQDFLAIARLYAEAGRPEPALAWAEKGLAAFPQADQAGAAGLRDFLADLYAASGRREDALTLAWAQFLAHPDGERYGRLKTFAAPDAWPRWREHALAHLRGAGDRPGLAGQNTLVGILLSEHDLDAALAEARAAGSRLRPDLWLALAARLESARPADALEIYRQQLDEFLARAEPARLPRQTDELLRKLRALFAQLGRREEFNAVRAELRAAHRHRRGFLKLLDALGRR